MNKIFEYIIVPLLIALLALGLWKTYELGIWVVDHVYCGIND